MVCEACGAQNKDGVLFCHECGKALVNQPIYLDLEQINVPASSRKAHVIKVSASRKAGVPTEDTLPESEAFNTAKNCAQSPLETQAPAHTDAPAQDDVPEFALPAEETNDPTTQPMKVKNWLPVFILSAIPCVNIIMLFVWSFSSKTNKSKQSFARLALIFTALALVLAVAALFVYAAFFNKNNSALPQNIFG